MRMLAACFQQPLRLVSAPARFSRLFSASTSVQGQSPLQSLQSMPTAPKARMSLMNQVAQKGREFLQGTKQLYHNTLAAQQLRRKQKNGEQLSYSQHMLLQTNYADIKRLYPFLLLSIILPESLPVVVYTFPKFLPSTFETAESKAKRLAANISQRAEMFYGYLLANQQQLSPTEWMKIKSLVSATQLSLVHQLLGTQFPYFSLATANKEQLRLLASILGVPQFYWQNLKRKRISDSIRSILSHDQLLRSVSLASLSKAELLEECWTRGLPSSEQDYPIAVQMLQQWLIVTKDKTVDSVALLLLGTTAMSSAQLQVSKQLASVLHG